jgi:uncharacterized SAM-binding protein YcdF (DUF218 family)
MVYFLLPPVSFAILALLGMLAACFGWRGGRWLARAAMLALILCSLPVVAEGMLSLIEGDIRFQRIAPDAPEAPQAIVVIGGTMTGNPLDGAVLQGLQPGELTLHRLRAAALLHQQTGLPVMLSGGAITKEPGIDVNGSMNGFLQDELHVTARWREEESRTTWENAQLSAAILQPEGVRRIYLVTDGWHMPRAVLSFRRAGFIVTPAPATLEPPFNWQPAKFLPGPLAWMKSFYAAHEIIGYLVYALRS